MWARPIVLRSKTDRDATRARVRWHRAIRRDRLGPPKNSTNASEKASEKASV